MTRKRALNNTLLLSNIKYILNVVSNSENFCLDYILCQKRHNLLSRELCLLHGKMIITIIDTMWPSLSPIYTIRYSSSKKLLFNTNQMIHSFHTNKLTFSYIVLLMQLLYLFEFSCNHYHFDFLNQFAGYVIHNTLFYSNCYANEAETNQTFPDIYSLANFHQCYTVHCQHQSFRQPRNFSAKKLFALG